MRRLTKQPTNFRPVYLEAMNLDGRDSNCVQTPPIHDGFLLADRPPTDPEFDQRLEQFRKGKVTCQKAIVAMFWIQPYSDFRPSISKQYRHYIDLLQSYGANFYKGPVPIVLYEHKGQLIMAADYKTYWVHRRDERWTVDCLILGKFTERDNCRGVDEPFTVSSLDLTIKEELMNSDTRRLSLLLRGAPMRAETREEREAINRKDFEEAITAPVEYEPDYIAQMNQHGEDPNFVFTPALHEGHFFGPPPEDERYSELAVYAQTGQLDCQLTIINLGMIRPYSDYKPIISDEFREEFDNTYEEPGQKTITVYEYELGHFMVGGIEDNYATYMLYREHQALCAHCIILGAYTDTWAVTPIDKPFRITLSAEAGYDPEHTTKYITRRLHELMEEKHTYRDEVARLAEIDPDALHKIFDNLHPELPSIDMLERIARVLGVKASDILPF